LDNIIVGKKIAQTLFTQYNSTQFQVLWGDSTQTLNEFYILNEQFRHICKSVICHAQKHNKKIPVLKFIGTVKIHGTNAAIGYQKDTGHWFQSRNNTITPRSDHEGFARTMEPLAEQFLTECILPQSRALQEHYEQGRKIIVFGEWCGGKIQKKIAIYGLPKMFVIFKVLVCDEVTNENTDESNEQNSKSSFWLQRKEWCDINWHEEHIYNIFDFPTYDIDIDFECPALSQNHLVNTTEAVEEQCPVGTYFHKTGVGEGIVWTEWEQTCGDLNFKVKGEKHSVSKVKTLASVDTEKFVKFQEFVDYACTENRMLQGLDFLREQQLTIDIKNFSVFMRWLSNDIIKEEKDILEASALQFKDVGRLVQYKAKQWFLVQLY